MTDSERARNLELARKIARLVEERGWNQEDFARAADLNRQTVRKILQPPEDKCRLRNVTIRQCAQALGLNVSELRQLPLDRLLARVNKQSHTEANGHVTRLYDAATQPEVAAWAERNPERARGLSTEELDELLSLQGTGGPLTHGGVEHFVERIERKRRLIERVHAIAGTQYLEFLEQLVGLLYDKIQPYRDRT
jgi:transcriptional regulator with XRE-family HTH domain